MPQVTILMVDDDEGYGELVRRGLQRSGISNPIVSLTNGRQALDYVFCRGAYADRSGNGDLLVLLDINMPGINGAEVLRQMKSHETTRLIPVLMVTTTDDPREVNRCYALGCHLCITKPVDPSEFLGVIQRLGLFNPVVAPSIQASAP